MFLKLLWKEYRVQRWALVPCALSLAVAILNLFYSFAAIGMASRIFSFALFLTIVVLPIPLCLNAFAQERARKTLATLAALPVPLWQVYLPKILACLALLAANSGFIAVIAIVLSLNNEPRFLVPLLLAPLMMFSWILALSIGARTPARAAGIGIVTVIGAYLGMILPILLHNYFPDAALFSYINPLGFFLRLDDENLLLSFGSGMLTCFVLCLIGFWRFRRLLNRSHPFRWPFPTSPGSPRSSSAPANWRPHASPLRSLLWKHWRELRWYVLPALLAMITLPMIITISQYSPISRYSVREFIPYYVFLYWARLVPYFIYSLAYLLAVALATAPIYADLSEKLPFFWQSTPITLQLWFWTKYFTGLIALLLTVILPLLFTAALAFFLGLAQNAELQSLVDVYNTAGRFLLMLPLTLTVIYTVAVNFSILTKNPFYTCLLTVVVWILLAFLPAAAHLPQLDPDAWLRGTSSSFNYPVWASLQLLLTALFLFLARTALLRTTLSAAPAPLS